MPAPSGRRSSPPGTLAAPALFPGRRHPRPPAARDCPLSPFSPGNLRHEHRSPCRRRGPDVLRQLPARQHAGRGLAAAGRRCSLAPLYTPLRTDEQSVAIRGSPSAGSTSICSSAGDCFATLPWSLDRLLDRPALLRWAGRRGAGTRPEHLGAIDRLDAPRREGRQRKELEKLLDWLDATSSPTWSIFRPCCCAAWRGSSATGWACRWSARCPAKTFLESCRSRTMTPPGRVARAGRRPGRPGGQNALLRRFHGRVSAVPRERIHVIPPGLNLQGHAPPGSPCLPANGRPDHWLPLADLPGERAAPVPGCLAHAWPAMRSCRRVAGPRLRISRPGATAPTWPA